METFWFIAVGFMLTMYVILDGFDLGAGIVHLMAARTDRERRTILNAIGVGRQRGVVDRCRRHTLFRFSQALCLELQRLLFAIDDGAVVAHATSGRHRVPPSRASPHVEIVLGRGILPRQHLVDDLFRRGARQRRARGATQC